MNILEQKRRSFLFSLSGLAASATLLERLSAAKPAGHQGYVLGASEGEHLIHFRDHGNIFIKASATTG